MESSLRLLYGVRLWIPFSLSTRQTPFIDYIKVESNKPLLTGKMNGGVYFTDDLRTKKSVNAIVSLPLPEDPLVSTVFCTT